VSAYVDDMRQPATVGRIHDRWSHLFADTTEELVEFAAGLGLKPEWIQHAGTIREHFDVTSRKREAAIAAGAQPIRYPDETADLLAKRKLAQGVTSR
jgi:hypothetical protein